jgi:glycosyltransferase involved in cell wall biosynthesis
VARALVASGRVPDQRIDTLFHPDLHYCTGRPLATDDRAPLRILFFGRILPYKGLPLFAEALELLARRGVPVTAAVYGVGDLGVSFKRLRALGVKIENRWIGDGEVSTILAQYDVMVLSHTSASQSGVAAAALGAGLPVVATPVGGIVDQIDHERTGLLAARIDAEALADAIERLAKDRAMLRALRDQIRCRRNERSMAAFLDRLIPITRRAAEITATGVSTDA